MIDLITRIAALALLPAALLGFASCSSVPEGTIDVAAIETADGAIIVETFTTTATVTAIDTGKRSVTLVTPGGRKGTYVAGPDVVNFAQIRVGDQVTAKVTEEAAVYIGSGAPPSALGAAGVALAPVGAKPGGVYVETYQTTVRVSSVDAAQRKVTLQLADGSTTTVKVGKKVDLSAVRVGDNVTAQVSKGLALSVERP